MVSASRLTLKGKTRELITPLLGLGTHRDFGAITILLQDEVPGLEYWDNRNKEFVGVQPLAGALVVNMGNMFQQWTNDV
jgi:isopenicillin N synthase-like dioxygenase